jgi:Ca2+-binding EF-hand superfamily protein
MMDKLINIRIRGIVVALAAVVTLGADSAAWAQDATGSGPPAAATVAGDDVPGPGSPQALLSVLTKLSPQNMRALGEMLENDWKDRPEWGEEAVAILKGEGMRPGGGWWKAPQKRYDFRWLRERFDTDGDGAITVGELPENLVGREETFRRLDRDLDGKLLLLDFDWFNRSLSTPRAMMTEYMFMRFDADSNGRISEEEVRNFFRNSDREKLGFLTHEDLFASFDMGIMSGGGGKPLSDADVVRMFFNGELGTMEAGPELEAQAPDFLLPTIDGERNVRLSEHFGKRPVVLVFGSFT